ncbi:sulfite exporter TauE/SafE family protein [Oerskovia sp. NPDC060338]|uniref:sulfite exporter TauE/SafE family protein n=1 Tax=Micrococcales TaxID=85006 RepID=UPI00271C31FB|nr:sulfite exporter TauE/SafE family protein [Microbacterium sp.]MDO8382111.1 sulfite exporter TauE/SafE family protein [Microbacterium sp.]
MSGALILTLVLAALVGLALGTLGGGGSILTVPLLTYVAGMPPKEAIAASLLVVGVTSIASLVVHARGRRVRWRTGLIFGAAGMIGAFAGGLLGGQLPGTVLMIAFALMMIATATAMILKRPGRGDTPSATEDAAPDGGHRLPLVRTVVDGVVVGLITGVVGAGGGFLIVPALVLLGGLSMPVAVGTSLLVISMKSFAGLAGYLTTVTLDWPVVAVVTAIAVVGALLGAKLSGRIPAGSLQKGFGVFVLLAGALVLGIELPPVGTTVVTALAVLVTTAFLVCRFTTINCPFRLGKPTPS